MKKLALLVLLMIYLLFLCVYTKNLYLKSPPKYIAEGPDFTPHVCLYDGDLTVLIKLSHKMSGRMTECASSVTATFGELFQ